jgi:hypothetical protein
MLRLVRRGDRHDPRDLTVSFRLEGDFEPAFIDGRTENLLPGEALKRLVHGITREHGGRRGTAFRRGPARRRTAHIRIPPVKSTAAGSSRSSVSRWRRPCSNGRRASRASASS